MKIAAKIGMVSGNFLHHFDEDLEFICKKYQKEFEKIKELDPLGEMNGWFIRTEGVSLKYGTHGAGPYEEFHEIIESMVTST